VSAAVVGTLDTGLRRRMLSVYLWLMSVPYTLTIVLGMWLEEPGTDIRGEAFAAMFCVLGLVCCLPAGLPRWRYTTALSCVVAAPVVALAFHHQLAAQTWSVVPLMFAAIFVRTWHRPVTARLLGLGMWALAATALLIAPAPVPSLWLAYYGVSILGAAEMVGIASSALVIAALRDPLTSAWNRAGVDAQARRVFAQARRRNQCVAVIVLDFDDFKGLNDRDGHAAGDAALGDFTHLVHRRLPESAVFGRLGGDEFVVIVSGVDQSAARELAAALADGHLVDVSYGVAAGHPDTTALAELFDAADADLYQRKRSRKGIR
jgi:diguanylate cyclase (GGDEF)-like protein